MQTVRVMVGEDLLRLLGSRALWLTLVPLLLIDLGFLAAHISLVVEEWWGWTPPGGFGTSLGTEGGVSETYEVAKAALCVAALALVAWRTAQPIYAALAAAFALALADNMLGLHEAFGAATAPFLAWTSDAFESAPQALGSFGFFMLEGVAILLALWAGFRRSSALHRRIGSAFVLLLLALGGFAAGLDLLHSAVGWEHPHAKVILAVVEDGGELLVLTLAAALAAALLVSLPARQPASAIA